VGPRHPGRSRLIIPPPAVRSSRREIVIVGAGAAGLATGIFIRRFNPAVSVTVLDGAAKPGAKILVSGGSRCNVTNASVSESDFWGGKPTIIRRVLRGFPAADAAAWFASLGVPLHEEDHGKLFPDSNRSRDVLDALLRELQAAGAVLRPSTRVTEVTAEAAGFCLHTSQGALTADRVVLATGGESLPKTGSDGAGLAMARRLGHAVVPTTPALAPLTLDMTFAPGQRVQGVAQDVEVAVWINGSVATRLTGALLWTHFGVSGPVILNASRHWLRAHLEAQPVLLTISLCPGEGFESVDATWTRLSATRPRLSVLSALAELVPARFAAAVVERLGLQGAMPLTLLTRGDRRRLAHALVQWPLAVTGSRGYNYAEATAGGVALEEINPATMESRRCPGLYLVGEMLDVDGRIGGFNFQWAWSSGRVAARAIAGR
jgi:predicted Rossmann fold flavoprotein